MIHREGTNVRAPSR